MAVQYETTPQALIDIYKIGVGDGRREGAEDMQARLLARIDKLMAERSGSPHDVGLSVLEEARERLAATVEDITPQGVRSHG